MARVICSPSATRNFVTQLWVQNRQGGLLLLRESFLVIFCLAVVALLDMAGSGFVGELALNVSATVVVLGVVVLVLVALIG